MTNEVNVDPRYSKYTTQQIEDVLDKVHNADEQPTAGSGNMISSGAVDAALDSYVAKKDLKMASEEEVRGIVKNWSPDQEPEPEPSEE